MAREAGFDGTIVMGLWDPTSRQEIEAAVAQREFVDGYCVGNEGLGTSYDVGELERTMTELRRRTGKQTTTSEPITRYIEGPDNQWLVDNSDWLFPIAHPALVLGRGGQAAVDWITVRHDYLVARHRKKVVLKEAGFPSGGATWATEQEQLTFFQLLREASVEFYFFEAFDQPDKHRGGPFPVTEQNWGLFRADGSKKSIVKWIEGSSLSRSNK